MSAVLVMMAVHCFGVDRSVSNGIVTVVPDTDDAILANPGMGWQTFHRTAKNDKSLPAWIPSTVHYARWGWGTFEPKPGIIDAEFIAKTLRETRESGQRLAFRVMCHSSSLKEPYLPPWLSNEGGKILYTDYGSSKDLPIPDFDDEATLGKHIDFIKRLGAICDGNPDIDHIDIGSLGWWGEWHLSGQKKVSMPTLENQRRLVDAYRTAFKKTPLIMLIGGGKTLSYAVQNGAGWRADCIGDMGGFGKTWCHMCQGYPVWMREAEIMDAWKTAPVAFESCWDMRKWVDEKWSLRHIFNYMLALHASYLNNKSAPLPPDDACRAEVERFLKRFGYRLELQSISYPAAAKPGSPFTVSMRWRNTGSAPCYRPYRIAYRFGSGETAKVFVGTNTVNRLMPGSVELFSPSFMTNAPDLPFGDSVTVNDTVTIPASLTGGDSMLAIGVVDETNNIPVIRLAIKGRDDGWYPMGTLRIEK